MRIVYADTLFIVNFAADYIALLAAGRFSAARLKRPKIALAALLGSLYAVLAAVTELPALASPLLRVPVGAAMALFCFREWRAVLLFFAFSALLGGAALAFSGGAVTLEALAAAFLLCLAGASLVLRGLGRRERGGFVRVEIFRGGRSVALTALKDTGNSLRDPVSGDGAIIAEADAVLPLFTPEEGKILLSSLTASEKAEKLARSPARFRVLPYASLGGKGLLLAFRPERLRLGGREAPGVLVAVAPGKIAENGLYSAIA